MKRKLLLFLATFACAGFKLSAQNATQISVGTTAATNTITNNVATAVDPGLTLTANGNITGFIVSISDSYTAGDVLSYTGTLPSGVSATAFNTTTRSLVFTGTTSAANWQTLLRTVTLQTTSASCFPERRSVSFTAGNKYYNPLTGHFYEYYTTAQTWPNAKTYASTQSYFGRQGYLATMTSAAENNFIWKILGSDAWIGGSDDYLQIDSAVGYNLYASQTGTTPSEGKFYWVTGPEKGTFYSSGNGSPVTQSGQYANWNGGEPNNSGNENFTEIYSSNNGLWNDLGTGNTLGCVIEYGGMPTDATSSTVLATRNIYVNGAPSGTVNGGNVSVCTGTNSTTLTLSGYTGSVVRWESSLDNFLTTGTTISSTSNSYTVSNISQTTYYRAIVNTTSPATCSGLATSSTPITVTNTVAGNLNADNSTICPNSSVTLTLYGNSGNILKWQVSTSSTFASSVTDINNTTSSITYTLATAGTYYFRAQVQNSGCGSSVYTPGYTITVTSGTPPVGGSVSSTEHCTGSNSGTLTLTGYTGTISKWQYTTDGTIWNDVANTTASLNYSGVTATRLYRAVVTNGVCGSVNSTSGSVIVYGNTQYQWLGSTNSTASTASNWKCTTTPPTGVDVVIGAAAANDLVLDQSYTFGNIDFSNSTRSIILGNYDLTVTSLTGTNATKYIKTTGTGKLKINVPNSGSVTFPVGNSAYNPVTITNNSGAGDYFAIKVYDEVYANGTTGTVVSETHLKRTWDITKTNLNSGSGISFVFNWNNGEVSGTMATPTLYHYSGGWSKQTGTTSSTSNSLTYTGYTGTFSPFTVAEGNVPLPISWISFTAAKQDKSVVLDWVTAKEKNVDHYNIQHSLDGKDWESIGTKSAAGNISSTQQYEFVHQSPATGNNYYRILEHDADGKEDYSKVVAVNFSEGRQGMSVYPNPATNGVLNIKLEAAAIVQVYNSMGVLVMTKELSVGVNQVNMQSFPRGVYMIKSGNETVSFVMQ
ncbi:T9SS type A sorting domain-containing protein [Chitinophagaceae bacterium MMS25-I14]